MTTMTSREQRRARTLDDPRFERFRNPRARRVLALAMIALILAEAGLFLVTDVAPILAAVGLTLVVVVFVFCLGALKASTRGLEELPESMLDERQAQVRGQVYATAYRVGSVLLAAGLAAVVLWLMLDLGAPGRGVVIAAVVVPFHLAIVLPTLVAALRADV